jgi:hypothetical protein
MDCFDQTGVTDIDRLKRMPTWLFEGSEMGAVYKFVIFG